MDTQTLAVAFSGGWDSTYCLIEALTEGPTTAYYMDYGQGFLDKEYEAAKRIAEHLGANFQLIYLPELGQTNGVFENRNSKILAGCAVFGHKTIYFGSRNPFPMFDRYGDSNWVWGKLFGLVHGVKVRMPVTGMTKPRIIESVIRKVPEQMIYSTEEAI